MFCQSNIVTHLMRGVVAAALIGWARLHQASDPVFAAIAVVLAIVAMRGCPMCWTSAWWKPSATGSDHPADVMLFRPNPSSGVPIYLQLMEQVKHASKPARCGRATSCPASGRWRRSS